VAHEVAEALATQRCATLDQLHSLEEADWDRACLPPWRVREVVAHLVAVDEALVVSGRLLPALRTADLERWNEAAVVRNAALAPGELLERLERSVTRVERIVARLPRPLARLPLRTALGRHPLHVLLSRRVLDEWVHTVDIARATGAEELLPEGVAEELATGVLAAVPALSLPRLQDRAGVVRLVVETGAPGDPHGPRRTWGIDFARRQYGPRVTARPDATVRLHASVLALLDGGRLAWPEAKPAITIEGDDELAGRVLDGLGA
jgi:uncharacterized protein (TIGR03083 family)